MTGSRPVRGILDPSPSASIPATAAGVGLTLTLEAGLQNARQRALIADRVKPLAGPRGRLKPQETD